MLLSCRLLPTPSYRLRFSFVGPPQRHVLLGHSAALPVKRLRQLTCQLMQQLDADTRPTVSGGPLAPARLGASSTPQSALSAAAPQGLDLLRACSTRRRCRSDTAVFSVACGAARALSLMLACCSGAAG
jgi:hypothetical protein